MAQAAAAVNASIAADDNAKCVILDTSRQYEPEAQDLFGPGYLALQLHVLQNVTVTSKQSMTLEAVTEVVASGYAILTGGRQQFIGCLHQYDGFGSVLSVVLRRGLWSSEALPSSSPTKATPSPTLRPTLAPTTRSPTLAPTAVKTPSPSTSPTSAPSLWPTITPTLSPSVLPSYSPSDYPSTLPSALPSQEPTVAPSDAPSMIVSPTWSPVYDVPPVSDPYPSLNGNLGPSSAEASKGNDANNPPTSDPLVVAAIAGATATVIASCIFAGCVLWRKKRRTQKRRSKPKYALTSRDGQLGKIDPDDMIPGFVELDQRSLAETTLGERTAGWPRAKPSQAPPKKMRPVDSFDENSLYTSPVSAHRGDDASSYHQTHTGPSILASHVMRPRDYDGKLLFPLSDNNTVSSDGVSSFGLPSGGHSVGGKQIESNRGSRDSGASNVKSSHDLESQGRHLQQARKLEPSFDQVNDQPKAAGVSQAIHEGSVAYDIDTWSYDFEEFDRGSDFYEGEAVSRSPSHSSRSTAKAKNLSKIPGSTGSLQHSNNATGESTKSKMYMEVKKGHRSPSNDESKGEPKRPAAPWSPWNSMFQNAADASAQGATEKGSDYQSPLSKLLDSVTQAVSPLQSSRSIPAVTPEETESDIDQPTDTSLSREDDSTLLGLQFKDDTSASSASTGMSASPWLLEKVEESLGPRSATADMESLSGKSNLSIKSAGRSSKAGAESMASFGSQMSHRSGGLTHKEVSFAPKAMEHDLKRLEKQLAALDGDQVSTSSAGVSSITGTSLTKATSVSSKGRVVPKVSRQKRIVVIVPPGKLGVILANRHDGKGTVVSEIRETSPLFRMLSPGDKLVAIDSDDVTNMVVSQITSLMASRADRERRLTVITSVPQQYSKLL